MDAALVGLLQSLMASPTGSSQSPSPTGPDEANSVGPDLGQGLSLWDLIRADYAGQLALEPNRPRNLRRHADVLTQPGFWAVVMFRLVVASHRAGLVPISRLLWLLNLFIFGTEMSPRAYVGPGLVVPHPLSTGFGGGTRIGRNVRLGAGVRLGSAGVDTPERPDGLPTVGDGCRIMDGAKLFGPIEIGPGAVIGANALVMRSIPAGAVVVSAPGRVIRVEAPAGETEPEAP
jgi:serine O-acetyltransferase